MGAGSIGGGIEWTTLIARPGLWTPGRPVSAPSLVVVHCTQGDSAGGAAQWFTNSAARGSAHVVIDDTSAYRCVNDMDTAYHARSVNSYSLGLEITGYASWTTEQWMEHKPRLMEAARTHAGWNLKYGIPMEWSVTRGYHSHKGLPGNDHTDPGDGFPWDFYVATVKATMAGAVMNPPEFGNTLRIRMPDGRVYGGGSRTRPRTMAPPVARSAGSASRSRSASSRAQSSGGAARCSRMRRSCRRLLAPSSSDSEVISMGDQPKVSAGWQTWFGYGFSLLLVAAPAILAALDSGDPWQKVVLAVAGALLAAALAGSTGKNRSNQAVALINRDLISGATGGSPMLSSAEQNVELSDSMPMDAHEPNAE